MFKITVEKPNGEISTHESHGFLLALFKLKDNSLAEFRLGVKNILECEDSFSPIMQMACVLAHLEETLSMVKSNTLVDSSLHKKISALLEEVARYREE